jgi:hypothetical protein
VRRSPAARLSGASERVSSTAAENVTTTVPSLTHCKPFPLIPLIDYLGNACSCRLDPKTAKAMNDDAFGLRWSTEELKTCPAS